MSTPTMSRVHVFVMQPHGNASGYTFPWDWGKWIPETRLIPLTDSPQARAMGRASFQMLRQIRREPNQATNAHLQYADSVIAGAWICIAVGAMEDIYDPDEDGLDETAILWWGWISHIDKTPVLIDSVVDAIGTVSALEVGHLFDSVQISGWRREGTAENYPEPIQSPPTANMGSKSGAVIGNAVYIDETGDGTPNYFFTRLAEDCGTDTSQLWNRWRLLRHFVQYCQPRAFPQLVLACADEADPAPDPIVPGRISTYLNDTTGPEIYELRELTLKGALDLLIPDTHDLDYRVDIGRESWIVRIATVSTDGTLGLPAADTEEVTLDATCVSFDPSDNGADIPDEVVLEGGQHLFGVSASKIDENWDSRFTVIQEADYEAADPKDRCSLPQYEDTYTLFGLIPNESGDLRRKSLPGEDSTDLPMCPEVGWDGTNVRVQAVYIPANFGTGAPAGWASSTKSYAPYLPAATLAHIVPWPLGVLSDGTDERSPENKAQPTYLKPKVFNYDDSEDPADVWFELTAQKNAQSDTSILINDTPQVEADDRGAGLRIKFNPPHVLARDTFDESADDDGRPPEIDWRNFVATLGIHSDQRLRIVKRRQVLGPGPDGVEVLQDIRPEQIRRTVTVRDDKFQFWAVLKGTVLGVKDDGSGGAIPDRLTASNEDGNFAYITRNDYPAAERYACRLATWAFRPRNPVSISLLRPDLPPAWARIGVVVGDIIDRASDGTEVTFTSNTIIRQIRRTWTGTPRIEISTDLLPQPRPSSPSAAAGGAVSVATGGTLAQGVCRLRSAVDKLQESQQRRIIYPANSPSASVTIRRVQIIGGNVLPSSIVGIKYAASVTPLAVYDPDIDTSYPDGLGNAWLHIDGIRQANRVLVRHNFTGYTQPFVEGRVMAVIGQTTLVYSATPMVCLLVDFP